MQENVIDIINTNYSNYFFQKLFFNLSEQIRTRLIQEICENIEKIYFTKNGICTIISIFENLTSFKDQKLFIDLLYSLFNEIWNPNKIRLAECIVGCFPQRLVEHIVELSLRTFMYLIKVREGYFLLRIIVRSYKDINIQSRIMGIIMKEFKKIAFTSNGSLLLQCIIHNFPLAKYIYTKSCINTNQHKEEENTKNTKDNIYDYDNEAVYGLILSLMNHVEFWDDELIKPIVDCAIKVSPLSFKKALLDKMNNKHFVNEFLRLIQSKYFIKLIVNQVNFEKTELEEIIFIIIEKIRGYKTLQKQEWKMFIKKLAPSQYQAYYENKKSDHKYALNINTMNNINTKSVIGINPHLSMNMSMNMNMNAMNIKMNEYHQMNNPYSYPHYIEGNEFPNPNSMSHYDYRNLSNQYYNMLNMQVFQGYPKK